MRLALITSIILIFFASTSFAASFTAEDGDILGSQSLDDDETGLVVEVAQLIQLDLQSFTPGNRAILTNNGDYEAILDAIF